MTIIRVLENMFTRMLSSQIRHDKQLSFKVGYLNMIREIGDFRSSNYLNDPEALAADMPLQRTSTTRLIQQ